MQWILRVGSLIDIGRCGRLDEEIGVVLTMAFVCMISDKI